MKKGDAVALLRRMLGASLLRNRLLAVVFTVARSDAASFGAERATPCADLQAHDGVDDNAIYAEAP